MVWKCKTRRSGGPMPVKQSKDEKEQLKEERSVLREIKKFIKRTVNNDPPADLKEFRIWQM
jgi:hypothetical protein